ncbi:MAG: hypothetical protein Wins2KO_03190 [Winogradskyella sp.]
MKHFYTLILIAIFSISISSAQTPIDVITGLNNPLGITFVGDELYIAEVQAQRVVKLDVTSSNSTLTEVVTGIYPVAFSQNGNDLFIVENSNTENKISKINLTETSPMITNVVTNGLNDPYDALLVNNTLYISQFLGDKISQIDITESSPNPVNVLTGLDKPNTMLLNGNDLYFTEFGANKISKIDITNPTPVATDVITGVNRPFGMVIIGNELFISQILDGKISKIDLTSDTPTLTDVVTGLDAPSHMRLNGNDLYISELSAGKISKIENFVLSIPEFQNDVITLYPNPSSDFIKISNLKTEESYHIYNSLGAEIQTGIISIDGQIDIRDLAQGLYFLKIRNKATQRFIKD